MGIFDFVKNGVQRMMIARPDSAKEAVVFKHPDQTFAFWSQLTVDSDEVCLFFKDGIYVTALGPGRHTLDTQNIPILNQLVDKLSGGNVFISELFFVTIRPLYNQGFGGPIGSMRDPELDLRVNPRAFGTYSYRVADAVAFVKEFVGQTGAADPERALGWVRDQLLMGLRSTLTKMIRDGSITMMDLGMAGPDVARATVQACPDLAKIGVQVLEIAKLDINLSAEDRARVDEFQDQIVQAKLDARKAKIAISQAEAEAQQRQFQLDQEFFNRQRYLQQLDMQRYQQYANAEALMGMGQGMAQGGDAGSAGAAGAMAAAGMALGMGLGTAGRAAAPGSYPLPPPGYAPQGYPGQGYPGQAPGYPAQGYPGQGYPGQAPGYPAQGYPGQAPGYPAQGYAPGYAPQGVVGSAAVQGAPSPAFVDAPNMPAANAGAAPAAVPPQAGRGCGSCNTLNPPGSRFCSSCGTKLA